VRGKALQNEDFLDTEPPAVACCLSQVVMWRKSLGR